MPAPNVNWGEIITTTLEDRRREIADAVTKNTPLYYKLRTRAHFERQDGGISITTPVEYGENPNFSFYSGYEPLALAPADVLTSAVYQWKQWAIGVTISGLELMQNRGKNQIINMLKARVMNAEKTLANNLARAAYSDGTAAGGREIHGLQLLLSDAAGSTVGGIDAAAWDFWESRRLTGALTTSNIYNKFMNLYVLCSRNQDNIDLITTDNATFITYSESLHEKVRYQSKSMADAGFQNHIMFQTAPLLNDQAMDGYAPAGAYFLNTKYLKFITHANRNNVTLAGATRPLNQDSESRIIAGMGNLITTNRGYMGGRLTAA